MIFSRKPVKTVELVEGEPKVQVYKLSLKTLKDVLEVGFGLFPVISCFFKKGVETSFMEEEKKRGSEAETEVIRKTESKACSVEVLKFKAEQMNNAVADAIALFNSPGVENLLIKMISETFKEPLENISLDDMDAEMLPAIISIIIDVNPKLTGGKLGKLLISQVKAAFSALENLDEEAITKKITETLTATTTSQNENEEEKS